MIKSIKVVVVFVASYISVVLAGVEPVTLQKDDLTANKVLAYSVAEPKDLQENRKQEQKASEEDVKATVALVGAPVTESKPAKNLQEVLHGVKKTVEQIKSDLNKMSLKIGKLERKIQELEALTPVPTTEIKASVPKN